MPPSAALEKAGSALRARGFVVAPVLTPGAPIEASSGGRRRRSGRAAPDHRARSVRRGISRPADRRQRLRDPGHRHGGASGGGPDAGHRPVVEHRQLPEQLHRHRAAGELPVDRRFGTRTGTGRARRLSATAATTCARPGCGAAPVPAGCGRDPRRAGRARRRRRSGGPARAPACAGSRTRPSAGSPR